MHRSRVAYTRACGRDAPEKKQSTGLFFLTGLLSARLRRVAADNPRTFPVRGSYFLRRIYNFTFQKVLE